MKINNDNGCRICGHVHWWILDIWEVSNCANPKCKCKAEDYMPYNNLDYLEELYNKKIYFLLQRIMMFIDPPTVFSILDGNNHMIILKWKNGKLELEGEGNLEVSAKVFFEFLKPHIDSYIKAAVPYNNLEYLEWLYNKKVKENV